MENSDDIRLIVKIAHQLGIYRTTISRLLKRGREPMARSCLNDCCRPTP